MLTKQEEEGVDVLCKGMADMDHGMDLIKLKKNVFKFVSQGQILLEMDSLGNHGG